MVSKVDPGEVYFITFIDQSTGKSQGYYKIGIVRNARDTAERIKEHQTGNPHRVIPYHIIKTDAPMLVEQLLHATYAKQKASTEWFKFTDQERDDAIKEGERLSQLHGPALKALRPWYHNTPTKGTLKLNGKALKDVEKIRNEAYDCESEMQKAYYLMKTIEHKLITINDVHGLGIEGVTHVKISPEKYEFNFSQWKKLATPAQKKTCEKPQKVDTMFEILYPKNSGKKATDAYWRGVHTIESDQEKAEKQKLPKHLPPAFTSTELARGKAIEQLHKEYCQLYGKHNLLKKQLEAKKIQLMMACMDHAGIDSICKWERRAQGPEINESLMKQHFPGDLTDKKFFKKTAQKAAVKAYPFRPYV